MTLVIFLIILVLSLFVSSGSIMGTAGDYEIYKNLLFDVNTFNINWEDINLVGSDLWLETRRYGLIWIYIMN